MRVLLIKTSSMGDVIHTLPALTDARAAFPDLQVDWVVEDAFADLARRHPAVANVFPCALRRWRKHPFKARRSGEWGVFKSALQATDYDVVIDAQGLIKSAFITRLARGPKFGLDKHSAREGLSAKVLDHPQAVAKGQHAIARVRQLFALSLGYALPASRPDYGLPRSHVPTPLAQPAELVFCHGTTWVTKHYPEAFWRQLVELACAEGHRVHLPWGNDTEKARAERLADGITQASVLPKMGLDALTDKLLCWDAFVAVDTGLAHLAAAAGLPGLALYGPTDPVLTGVQGVRAESRAADFPCAPCVQERCTYRGELGKGVSPPCFSTLKPEFVWRELKRLSP
ncbi:lipopolysaccharide heptosyltransferase I [Alcanivorax sp.]|uniref:lipopolysaccharide heptosyltransferase I n=1 Tax=Alcanivorax sp. TaxID=1872427 RepID=UPI00243CE8A4|nr:lipopolysaccharide heptosyltransferase I [Alcanivorax sp.]